ncbi:hypothetical protein SPHINGO8AM_130173 [Sphingomonas sp. 8AM]|nr:hypothetical protein SPHINGO8AM_130173 [Sphingomonas sp. 8AM]
MSAAQPARSIQTPLTVSPSWTISRRERTTRGVKRRLCNPIVTARPGASCSSRRCTGSLRSIVTRGGAGPDGVLMAAGARDPRWERERVPRLAPSNLHAPDARAAGQEARSRAERCNTDRTSRSEATERKSCDCK